MHKRSLRIGFCVLLLAACTPTPPLPSPAASPTAVAIAPATATPSPQPTTAVPTHPSTTAPLQEADWPTDNWETASPEALGIDSQTLLDFYQTIQKNELNVHSAIVVRHGYVAAEGYFFPFHKDSTQYLYSCTKSVISTLIGIAIEEGAIRSTDEKVLDFFPEYQVANLDDRKRALTLEHLLTMTSGFKWDEEAPYTRDDLGQMTRSPDWAQYVLDRPMAHEPGEFFYYNSGNSHLLSAILQQATGQTAAEYAREKLFDPLGFPEVQWDTDSKGRSIGGWGLALTPREMAKFGYLFLREGQWDGQTVVPADWVARATRSHIDSHGGMLTQLDYGYQWWTVPQLSPRAYSAIGRFGQWIIVVPEQDLVVVFASRVESYDFSNLVRDHLLSGVKAAPLPENPEAEAALQTLLAEIATASH